MLNIGLIQTLALAGLVCASQACGARGGPAGGGADTTAAAATSTAPDSKITTNGLTYRTDGTELQGFIAYPEGVADKRPGVLVVHEWWGLNDYARTRARKLAELGYVALAVDMYGGGRNSDHPDDAKKMLGELMSKRDEAITRFQAARAALAADPRVDPEKIAAIGYCFGGAVVLGAVRAGADLDAAASFHGNYVTDKPLAQGVFKGKVFVAHGAADSFSTPEQVAGMKRELESAGADHTFTSYEGAKHGFTNPEADDTARRTGLDVGYDATADAQSWQKLQEVLRAAFATP